MMFLSALLVAVCCLGVFLNHLKKRQAVKQAKLQLCMAKLATLKDLLIHIQQHRGLSTAVLHGDLSLKTTMQSKMSTVTSLCLGLEHDYPELSQDDLFEGISSHWQRLESRCLALSPSNNIEQHNHLIINLLYLIQNQAEENRLLMRFSRESGMEVIWKELLETIEAIGQTRAIGMGLVSEGKSTAVERIQLKYLNEKVRTQFQTLNTSFIGESGTLNASQAEGASIAGPFIKTADIKITELQAFINQHLLQAKINNISSEQFFILASSAIEPLNGLFNLALTTLEQRCSTTNKGWKL